MTSSTPAWATTPLAPNHASVTRRSSADTEGNVQRVLGKLEASSQNLTILQLLANDKRAFRPFVLMADALMNGSALPPDVREVVILQIARSQRYAYEWLEHVPIARRCGVSDEVIAAVDLQQGVSKLLTAGQQLGVEVSIHLLDTGALPASLWDQAVERWGLEGALQLALSVGWWGGLVATLVGALGLIAPDGL